MRGGMRYLDIVSLRCALAALDVIVLRDGLHVSSH